MVTCKLSGENGNAIAIIVRVKTALKHAGVSPEEIHSYVGHAMSGDYDHLLVCSMRVLEKHGIKYK